jgi:hypothetical protein
MFRPLLRPESSRPSAYSASKCVPPLAGRSVTGPPKSAFRSARARATSRSSTFPMSLASLRYRAALAEFAEERDRLPAPYTLYRYAREIAQHGYVQSVNGFRIGLVSSMCYDCSTLMRTAAREQRSNHDWSAIGNRPPKDISRPRGRPRNASR